MNAIILTDENFDRLLQSDKPLLVDFTADWCPPCRAMAPVIQELTTHFEDKALIGKLDVDANPAITARFGVRNLPTFLLFKKGVVVDRIVGAVPKIVLNKKLDSLL